jgi:hypothetical protein
MLNFLFPIIAFFVVYPIFSFMPFKDVNFSFPKRRLMLNPHNLKYIVMPFIFLIVTTPFLVGPISNFVNSNQSKNLPLYTFSDYDQDAAIYIQRHINSNVLVISDVFSVSVLSGLSGNSFSLSFRVPYDEIGNTHQLQNDASYLSSVKTLLSTTNNSLAMKSFSQINDTVQSYLEMNQNLDIVTSASANVTFLVVLSGRTSAWLTQGSDAAVVFPQNMTWLSGYQKFIELPYSRLIYESKNQVFIFELSQ